MDPSRNSRTLQLTYFLSDQRVVERLCCAAKAVDHAIPNLFFTSDVVGLDVHAETISVAVADQNGEIGSLGVEPNRGESIQKPVKKLIGVSACPSYPLKINVRERVRQSGLQNRGQTCPGEFPGSC